MPLLCLKHFMNQTLEHIIWEIYNFLKLKKKCDEPLDDSPRVLGMAFETMHEVTAIYLKIN